MLRCLVCGVLLTLGVVSATGQSVKKYDVRSGLSENTVRSIMQDSTGYMWFATKDGLNRFNGREFSVFNLEDKNGGEHLNIMKVIPHRNNRDIWVASTGRLYLFCTATESFHLMEIPSRDDGLDIYGVFDLCYDFHGVLWAGSSRGLFSYDEDSGTVMHYTHNPADSRSLPSNHVWVVMVDSGGALWAGTRNGLAQYRPGSDNFRVYSDQGTSIEKPACQEIISLKEASNGTLWAGTWAGGLACFSRETGRYQYFFGEGDRQTISRIRAIHETGKGELLIGSDDGLFRFDPRSGHCESGGQGLSGESVYCFYRDREDGLWIGTYFMGVTYISPKTDEIEWYFDDGTDMGFCGNAVSQFCEDADGNIWISTENGGLNFFERSTGRFVNYKPAGPGGISYNNLHALLIDGSELWIGTFSRGLDVMDLHTGKISNYRHSLHTGSLPNDHIYSLFRSSQGTIYVGTLSGLCIYNSEIDLFETVNPMSRMFIYDMAEDETGNMWFACQRDGVWRYDPAREEYRNYRHDPNDPYSLCGSRVIRAFIDDNGSVWFATEGSGVCRYVPEDDNFIRYDNLPDKVVYGILDDSDGHLWLSCNKGLIKYDTLTRRSDLYTFEDGLQSNQFNFRSSMKASDGKFFFGGVNGFNAFYPRNISRNHVLPIVSIPYVYIPDPQSATGEKSRLIVRDGKVAIDYKVKTFDVVFESLSYVAPGKNRYEYRIDNIHQEWNSNSTGLVSFLNLPYGNYTLRVRSSNNDGLWSENEAILGMYILPPPWLTPYAKAAYVLLSLLIVFFIVRFYASRLRRRREGELMEIDRRNQAELLQSKLTFFTHVAHEIKTPLSLINAPLESVMETGAWSEDTPSNLSLIKRNTDRLLELVRQLLDLNRIDKTGYKLSVSSVDVKAVAQEVIERFRSAEKDLQITLATDLDLPEYRLDRDAFTKIISNLVSNAIKYATGNIEVSMEDHRQEDVSLLRVTVTDDGPGISPAEALKLFEPFYQSAGSQATGKGFGIGLSLVKLLVEKHGGRVWFDTQCTDGCRIVFEIQDMEEGDAKEEGHEVAAVFEQQGNAAIDLPVLLVVEDTAELLGFLRKNLGTRYNVITATDGVEGLKALDSYPVDIIISDIAMPGMDGITFLKAVRANHLTSHIPVVLLTARGTVDSKIEGLDSGADSYIEKPFSLGHLRATLSNLLESRRMLFERFAQSPGLQYERLNLNGADSRWLEKMDSLIRENLCTPEFNIDALAAGMAVSRSNLQRKLKGLTGQTPNDYIRLFRLKIASQLLAEGKYRINEVCFMTGFNNLSYFTRCFQKQFGQLPRDFIKKSGRKS